MIENLEITLRFIAFNHFEGQGRQNTATSVLDKLSIKPIFQLWPSQRDSNVVHADRVVLLQSAQSVSNSPSQIKI